MKKNIFITVILFPLVAFSQEYEYIPFPDSGAIWSEVYYYPEPAWPDTVVKQPSYERFTLNGEDTIINEISYKKLFMFFDTVFNKSKATYIGGIREDENKKIYFKGDTVIHDLKPMIDFYNYEEIVLFDFSLNVGDTIKNINCRPEDDLLIVSKIDSVIINNKFRKMYHFNPMPWVKWIEGIGSVMGLLFTSGDLPINGLNNDLICFKQNEETLYFNGNYTECFPVLTGIETKKNEYSKIIVYPNPSNDNIRFDFGEQKIKRIKIIDCNGLVSGDFDIQMQSHFLLSLEKYQPGIYFYKATNIDGMVYTGKFVVR